MRFKSFVAGILVLCLCFGALPALLNAGHAAMPYYITVDVTNQIVTVFENGNRTKGGVVRQMICSTGAPGHSTPLGTFTLPKKSRSSERTEWYSFPAYSCYAKWATRIKGPYLFHSIIYNSKGGKPTSTSLRALGSRASHGCVRLRPDDAKWIALNCGAGTQVRIYYSGKYDSALRKKLLNHSFYRGTESYYAFLGLNTKIPLKKGSGGTLVKKLQTRLRALGFFTGSIGGNFLTITDTAVRNFQKAAGLKQDGVVTQKVWKRIFAANAPTGTYVALAKDSKGPAVSTLQRTLKAAKCYSGAINGKYDSATVKAMKKWQKVRGYTITGKASPSQQRKLLAVEKKLRERFGDTPYKLVAVKTVTPMARVSISKAGIYESPSRQSTKLLVLNKDADVTVLAEGDGWLEVQSGSTTGYMKLTSITRFDSTKVTYKYEAVDAEETVQTNGIPTFEVARESAPADEDLGWALVGGDGAVVRSQASADADAQTTVPAGAVLCALGLEDDWIRVTWQGSKGYVALADVTLVAEGDPLPEPEAEPAEEAPADEGLTLAEEDNAVVDAPLAVPVEDDALATEPEADEEAGEAMAIEEGDDAEETEEADEAPEALDIVDAE